MEKSSEIVERIVPDAVPVFNERERARNLVAEIAGHCWHGRDDMVDRVYETIRLHFPVASWTRRRVRAFWHREAAVVRWREIREMEFVAEVERAERLKQEEAKAAHNEFLIQIGVTLDRLAASDAEFHQEHRAALRQMALGTAHPQIGQAARESGQAAALGSAGDRL